MCKICELIQGGKYIYKDDVVAIIPSPTPCCKGHFLVVPSKHAVILEQLDDKTFATMMIAANRLAALLFETLNAEGTNILVRNGIPAGQVIEHIAIEVIPRYTQDDINLSWEPKQATQEDLARSAEELRTAIEQLEKTQQKSQQVLEGIKEQGVKEEIEGKEGKEGKEESIVRLPPRIP